ncbi:MAG: LPXTG cell wall anchor domain-containing protein, partial [Lachnospiraceae bacterium]|nr:LPXTG cell wall anchor domain-containing protein [Lachnospiraceae bacterium]
TTTPTATPTATPTVTDKPNKPGKSGKPSNPSKPNKSNGAPKTGDTSNLMLWIAMLGVSILLLIGYFVLGKRKKYGDRS